MHMEDAKVMGISEVCLSQASVWHLSVYILIVNIAQNNQKKKKTFVAFSINLNLFKVFLTLFKICC